ncbi:MAG: translocation/assembly module TamB domain-containing protein [Rhizobacter sp.]|nr:translocation/assembly module TamB domain-containing protein [Ferruginibacter sp.]
MYALPSWSVYIVILLLLAWAGLWLYTFRKTSKKVWFFLSMLLLVVFCWGLLQLSFVQNLVISNVTSTLSKELKTKVTIKKIDIDFFDRLVLNGLMVEDRKKDTLLYAGAAKVNITDYFFFKDKIVFKNVGLNDAVINMTRNDSVWNYQFIVDYFSGTKDSTKKKAGPDISVNELHFTNIRFNKMDGWVGQNQVVALKKMDLLMDSMDINKKMISIKDIYLEEPLFLQADFEGKKPKVVNMTSALAKIPIVSAFKWNKSGWVVKLGKLQIFNGSFQNDKLTTRDIYTDRFDGQHIFFKQINGNFSKVLFLNDTLHASIDLAAKERSGLEIKKLASDLKFTPELLEFNKLDLQTNKSKLGNYYSMGYQSFNKDMSSFLHNVTLEANFTESVLSSDDLAIFAPALSTMKRVFYLEGRAKGTIDNFSAKAMKIRTGNTYFDGDLSMRGLPDIQTTFIDLKSNLFQTNYNELSNIIPALKKVTKPSLAKLGNIKYKGNFTGFINDFVAFGNISTNLGNMQADLNMKLPAGNAPPIYSGTISTPGFELGQFIADKNFGNVALNGTIKGSGFTLDKLDAKFKGDISQLYYAGYTYRNATVDGSLKNKIFDGHLSINDPNIKIQRLDGRFSFANKELAFNADAELDYLDFQSLGISKDKLTLSGIFNLNFTGSNIDNFLGTARVYNAVLQHDSSTLSFDSLTLKSFIQDSIKNLELETNELYAKLKGKFNVQQLPNAFTIFLSRYYPTYIKAPNRQVSEQDFVFEIKTRNVSDYINLFDRRLSGFNNSDIDGSIRLRSNELNINAKVPEFTYDGKVFSGINLTGAGNRDTLYTDITAEDIKISDSLHFPDTKLKLTANNDISLIKLNTSANKTLTSAELNASIQSFDDGVRVHFFPSEFVLNNKKWVLEKDGELTLRKNYPIDANEIKFVSGKQEIVIRSQMEEETSNVNLVARLQSVILEDILPFFVRKPDFRGTLTGTAIIKDPFGDPVIKFEGVTDSLRMDGNYLGAVDLHATADTKTGKITYKVSTDGSDYAFNADGYYNYKDSTGDRMGINLIANKIRLELLQPYLKTVFSKMSGFAKGNIVMKNDGTAPSVIGDVVIDSASVTIAYTQCRYLINNETISFGKNNIDLGMLRVKDTLGNIGTVSGRMEHNFFRDFYFSNLRFETAKLLLLNTTKKDNIQFYGNIIGSALMTMNGPTSDLRMNIDGQPSSLDSSHIYLPTGAEAREGTKIDYIEFIQFGSEMDNASSNTQTSNILVNLNITANPACKVDVILDEETGDIIKAQGNGKLSMTVGTTEPMSMRGRYELTKGEYTFNFQTFLKRPFTLSQGSITWNGDPYLATINIDAEYLAKNVDISALTPTFTDAGITPGSSQKSKSDVIVLAHLTGSLKNPEIDFEFKFNEGSEAGRDFFVVKKLEQYRSDQNIMFKQVASLLLLNSFISDEQAFLSGQSTFNIAAGTVGGIMSSWLTNLFNKELERATKGVISTYIDINPTVDLQSQANQLQANVRAGLKIFLSSRVNVLVAGNYEYNNPYVLQQNRSGLFTPDISLEWLLNKDGSLRVVGFNRTSIDLTSSQRNRSGIQLAYRKDFDKISDIFKSRKKIQKRDANKYKVLPADTTFYKRMDTTILKNDSTNISSK